MDEQLFLRRLADQLEMPPNSLTPDTALGGWWDSVAVVSAIALIDDHFGVTVSGNALSQCEKVADILRLAKHRP